jgi:hypothetical protein
MTYSEMLAIDRLKLINMSLPCKTNWAKALLLILLVFRWLKPAAMEIIHFPEISLAGGS